MAAFPIVSMTDLAQRYLALVERSGADLTELYDSGRWKYCYAAPDLVERICTLAQLHDLWSRTAADSRTELRSLRRDEGSAPGANRP